MGICAIRDDCHSALSIEYETKKRTEYGARKARPRPQQPTAAGGWNETFTVCKPMNFNDNKLSRMSRRRFLRVASAMGVSATCLAYGTQEGLVAAADENEVPYVALLKDKGQPHEDSFEREPIYKSIPRDEYNVRYTADDAAQKAGQLILDEGWDAERLSPAWGAAEQTPHGFGVTVKYRTVHRASGETVTPKPSFDEVRSRLPNAISGEVEDGNGGTHQREVPVEVVRKTGRQVSDCQEVTYYGPDQDSFPGGGPCKEGTEEGTFCAEFYSSDAGSYGLITAGHVAQEGNTVQWLGEDVGVTQDSQDTIDIDWAFVDDSLANNIYNDLVNGDNTARAEYVKGIVTDSELKNDVGTSTTYYTQGRTTCRTSGTLIDTGGLGTSYVTATPDVDSGDSGGPLFKLVDGDAYIAGDIIQQINSGSDTKATTAETVENKANGFF